MPEPRFQPEPLRRSDSRFLSRITTIGIAVVVASIFFGYLRIQDDDSYIFYSYAKNLAEGHGYVFNPGERVNATSSPLYTLLLVLCYMTFRFIPGVTLPVIGHLIGVASLFAIGVALRRAFREPADSLFACLVPFVFLANPLLSGAVGMETFLTMALAVGSLAAYARDRKGWSALLCSFAVLSRPDTLLLAAILLTYEVVRQRRFPALGVAITFLLPIAAWLVFSKLYFGSLIPSTVDAKLAQTSAGLWGEGPVFLKGLFSGATLCSGISHYPEAVRITVVLLGLLVIGTLAGIVMSLALCRKSSIVLHPLFHLSVTWNFLYLLAYIILDAPAYSWYYTPLTLGMALLVTLPLETSIRNSCSNWIRASRTASTGLVAALTLVAVMLPLTVSRMPATERKGTHELAAEWLNARVPGGTSIGANDIGVLRFYYEKGPIIDGAGLVTPDVVDHLRRGEYSWYIREYRPAYLMFIEPPRSPVELFTHEAWFQKEYVTDTVIGDQENAVRIWRRITS